MIWYCSFFDTYYFFITRKLGQSPIDVLEAEMIKEFQEFKSNHSKYEFGEITFKHLDHLITLNAEMFEKESNAI